MQDSKIVVGNEILDVYQKIFDIQGFMCEAQIMQHGMMVIQVRDP